jgi:hypothetical protein
MITSLALSIIAIASGTLLTYTYDEGAPLVSRLCSGACIGFACLALVAFVLALFFGLTPATIIITAAILLLPFILLKNQANARSNKCGYRSRSESDQPGQLKPGWLGLHLFSVLCRRHGSDVAGVRPGVAG